ncbi:MAG: methyltransferase domain-containing protein, partial [bacterium]
MKENTFDGAFVINVFHHLSGLSSTSELHRVLKRGARYIVVVGNNQ